MNVSHEYKIIWWAPERSATKIMAQILKNFNFEYYNSSNHLEKIAEPYHSHEIGIPEGCEDYKIVCSMRNPYDRVLSLYLNFTSVGMNSVFTRDKKDKFIKRFNHFLFEMYNYAIYRKRIINFERATPVKDYIAVLNFEGRLPDYFIRTESLIEDLGQLDFINQSEIWNSGQIHDMVQTNNFKKKRPYTFDQVFSLDGANKVYQHQKKLFLITKYDPFSFTKEELSDETKKKFLHETF